MANVQLNVSKMELSAVDSPKSWLNVANVRLIVANVWLDVANVANVELQVSKTELSAVDSPKLWLNVANV